MSKSDVALFINLPDPLTSESLSLDELRRRITGGMELARRHGCADQAIGRIVYWALQTFIREYWQQLLPGVNRPIKDGDTFRSLAPIELKNLENLVLLIELLAAKNARSMPNLQGVVNQLTDMFDAFGFERKRERVSLVVYLAVTARVVLFMNYQLSLSPRHPVAELVRQEWLSMRQEIERLAQENPAKSDAGTNGDSRKHTAEEITDDELKRAIRDLFERLPDGQACQDVHMESELTRTLRLRGRKEGVRLKLHAINLRFVAKVDPRKPFYTPGPSLAA